jgi:hypothetical protein
MSAPKLSPDSAQTPDQQQPLLELVPPQPVNPDRPPEQLPLIRILQVVESIHANQRMVTEAPKDIKQSLPVQRRAPSKRTIELHILAISTRRNGLCPCCQETPVCTASGRLPGAEVDHWYSRHRAGPKEVWITCSRCNQSLVNPEFKTAATAAFESYQAALKPLLSRQVTMPLVESKEE